MTDTRLEIHISRIEDELGRIARMLERIAIAIESVTPKTYTAILSDSTAKYIQENME